MEGTPFGTFISLSNVDETFARFGAGRFLFGSPEEAIEYLDLARATKTSLVFSLVQGRNMRNEDGTFSIDDWRAGVDQFARVDFWPYVADGTIIGHYMIDEPKSAGSWGGVVVPNSVLDQMAAYSKRYWPSVPTIVRSSPERLIDHAVELNDRGVDPVRWQYLDVAWLQYNAALHGSVEDYTDAQVASANVQNLSLIVGLQALAGGDGTSQLRPEPPFEPHHWIMSYDEMMRYGTHILERGIGCAFITFRWDRGEESYFTKTDLDRAHTDLQKVSATVDPSTCAVR